MAASPIFPPKRPQKSKSEIMCHNIDFTQKFSLIGQKMAESWPKNVCPYNIYGIIGIFRGVLAYNYETKFIRFVLSNYIVYAKSAVSPFAFFAQSQSLILLLLLHFFKYFNLEFPGKWCLNGSKFEIQKSGQ